MKMYNLIQKDGNTNTVIAKGNFQNIEFLLYSTLDKQNIECINNHIGLHECNYHDASGVPFEYEMVEI